MYVMGFLPRSHVIMGEIGGIRLEPIFISCGLIFPRARVRSQIYRPGEPYRVNSCLANWAQHVDWGVAPASGKGWPCGGEVPGEWADVMRATPEEASGTAVICSPNSPRTASQVLGRWDISSHDPEVVLRSLFLFFLQPQPARPSWARCASRGWTDMASPAQLWPGEAR